MQTPADTIDRDSTVDRCHAALLEGILSGRWEAGARLRQEQLAAELGISRTPLREALRRLASEGLVEILPQRGARVAALGRGLVIDSYYARLAIETEAARIAARRATETDLGAMRDAVDELDREISTARAFELNRGFHLALVAGAHNEYLNRFTRHLWASRLAMPAYHRQTIGWADAPFQNDQHRAIVGAVADGDGEQAAGLVHDHIARAIAFVEATATPGSPRQDSGVR